MVYDIDFISDHLEAPPNAIYFYQSSSGVLRHELRRKLEAAAEKAGLQPIFNAADTPGDMFADGLFELSGGAYPMIDAGDFSNALRADIFASFIDNPHGKPRLLMMPVADRSDQFPSLPKGCLRIKEPVVDEHTADRVITFFQRTTRLYDFRSLKNKGQFRKIIREHVRDKDYTLRSMLQFLEEVSLIAIDPHTNVFDTKALATYEANEVGVRSVPRLVEDFIAKGDEQAFKQLIIIIDHRLNEKRTPAASILKSLQRSAAKALGSMTKDRSASVYWAVLLAVREPTLLKANFVVALYKLGVDFRRAKAAGFTDQSVSDMSWGRLAEWFREGLGEGEDGSPHHLLAKQLVEALTHVGEEAPSWMRSLRRIAIETRDAIFAGGADPAATLPLPMTSDRCDDPGWIARDKLAGFEQIVGQPFVAARLSEYSRNRRAGAPVMLYGPPGVGRTAIAELFARALLCETPLQSGSPCSGCEACKLTQSGSHPALIQLDAGDEHFEQAIERTASGADVTSLFSDRRVTIISNPRPQTEAALERVLKMLERETFEDTIFVADDLRAFSPAIRSRCDRLAVVPLEREDSLARLRAICQREGVPYEEAALEIIALQAHQGAGELFHCLWSLARKGEVTLQRAREGLDLNWPDLIHQAWMGLLKAPAQEGLTGFKAVSPNASEALKRLQIYLQWLKMNAAFSPSPSLPIDAAFLVRAADDAKEAIKLLDEAAARRSQAPGWLLDQALAFWADCDARDWLVLDECIRRFQADFLLAVEPCLP